MSTVTKSQPVQTMRLGPIKCSIWANEGADGRPYFSAKVVRSYRLPLEKREANEDGWRETHSMSEHDLVLQQELCSRAVTWIHARQNEDPEVDF